MLQIDPSIILVFAIIWILVLVLTKTVFNPIRRIMHDREDGIASDREAGVQAERAYEDSLRKVEDEIKQARAAAYAIQDALEKVIASSKPRVRVIREAKVDMSASYS